MGKNALTIGWASFSVILLKSPSLTKRRLWRFSSHQIRIHRDNRDRANFGTWSPIPAQLMLLPNRTNSIKCSKKPSSTVETQFFIVTWDFLLFGARPLIWMCCMKKVGWLFCCMEVGTCFKLFLLANFSSGSAITSYTTSRRAGNLATTRVINYIEVKVEWKEILGKI